MGSWELLTHLFSLHTCSDEAGGDDEDKAAGDNYDDEDGNEDEGGDDGGGHTEDDHVVAEPGERLTNRLGLQTCSDEGGE